MFALDNAEIERKEEAERLKEDRIKEHKRIQEEERARQIQERIFGKKQVRMQNKILLLLFKKNKIKNICFYMVLCI